MLQMNFINFMKRFAVRRKYRDVLFQRVFQNKSDLLALYNALNNTDYQDSSQLEITTLEDVIYLSMKNDLSFVISSTMNLYEHQSSYNPNMPIRGLLYFGRLYEAYIRKHEYDIYGSHLVKLPVPQYIVFYNGHKDEPDELLLKLSDSFQPTLGEKEPVLECTARMLNINYGHNQTLMNTCKRLHDYSYFIHEVETHLRKGYTLEHSIRAAINICIEKGILTDILEKQKSEVFSMLLTEYNKKLHDKTLRNEGRMEAYSELSSQLEEKDSKLQQQELQLQQMAQEIERLKALIPDSDK